MPFRRFRGSRGFQKRPIDSTKNVVDNSGAIVASTDTVLQSLITGTDTTTRGSGDNQVERGGSVKGFYLSLFFAQDVNSAAAAVPLMDWYIMVDKGQNLTSNPQSFGNGAKDIPVPGSTGSALNVNKIIHEEKGLIGEKNDGSKMVFQGVIKLPRGMQTFNIGDTVALVARSNEDAIFCLKCIYRWYK